MQINDVCQFNENHKWCGCLGVISERKTIGTDVRYMIGVPIPEKGTAYTYVMESENALELIGIAELVAGG